MTIILLIIAVILILNVFPKLFGFILQLAIITIGFSFHPLIGIFLLVAFAGINGIKLYLSIKNERTYVYNKYIK
jgi:hypothetical protein